MRVKWVVVRIECWLRRMFPYTDFQSSLTSFEAVDHSRMELEARLLRLRTQLNILEHNDDTSRSGK